MNTPNTSELLSSHIPALQTLMALGWEYLSPAACLDLRGGNQSAVLRSVLVEVLQSRRFEYKGKSYPLSANAIDQLVRELCAPSLQDGLKAVNERLYYTLTLGVTVTEFIDGKKHSPTISIIDWENPENNRFQVSDEVEVANSTGTGTRRPDVVGYVNGLPLVVIEAKRPASDNPNKSMLEEGISQMLRNQGQEEIPALFAYSQLLLSVSGTDGNYATTGTERRFWSDWKEEDISEEECRRIKNGLSAEQKKSLLQTQPAWVKTYLTELWKKPVLPTDQDRLLIGLLSKARLLEFIRLFVLFDHKLGKVVARYHQAFGVKRLLQRVQSVREGGAREGGVIWHTTGSGKSFTMVFFCKALLLTPSLTECRLLTVTDRVDLEKQLSRTFRTAGAFGASSASQKRGEAQYTASTGKDLAKRIGQGKDRILFSIINKFATAANLPECYNPSHNLIVLVDEGHRSHGGETHERMRQALPNAAYIAFTGTPLLKDDKTTNKFGPIVHAYTMRQAVSDHTVTPLLYEERQPQLDLNEKAIDKWFDKITLSLSRQQKRDLKKKYSKRGLVYSAEDRIRVIAWDISDHFTKNFKDLGLKGQLATENKLAAVRYHQALEAIGEVSSAVIISPPDTREGHSKVDEAKLPEVLQWWKENVKGNPEAYERQVLADFKTRGAPDILIVVDKLLTGFDEPANTVLYIDKSLKEHTLIQAIARVNRLHKEKKHGILIDYRGILKALDTAITEYQDLATRTQGGFDIEDIQGLYQAVSTEYRRLPALHKTLLGLFASVNNTYDLEQYRQCLLPKYNEDSLDIHQKAREDFYEALTEFALCLKTALSSRTFFEDPTVSEETIAQYKKDLKFFSQLRQQIKRDAQETVDYSQYDAQIRELVDKYVVGEDVDDNGAVYSVDKLGVADPQQWSEEKLRNETDLIKSRLIKSIDQSLADDPYAQQYFSELLQQAIDEAQALFDHPYKAYALFEQLEEKVEEREVDTLPLGLKPGSRASAYYGILTMVLADEAHIELTLDQRVQVCQQLETMVRKAVEENSITTQNIDKAISQQALPVLFELVGLDVARKMVERVIEVTRTGISRGGFS